MMPIRAATPDDAEQCARVLFDAFRLLAERHGFAPDFPSLQVAGAVAHALLADPARRGFVAETAGGVIGCAFVDIGDTVAGIGPVAVAAHAEDHGIGRALVSAANDAAAACGAIGVRLTQSAYNNRSLALYIRLGFRAQAPLSLLGGAPIEAIVPDRDVAPAIDADIAHCARLHRAVHGFERTVAVRAAVARGTATVVRHRGAITGYATEIGFTGHAVAADDRSLRALIAAAPGFSGPGFIVPTTDLDLVRWCFEHGLRVVMQMTLMSTGPHHQPSGPFLPSVLG